MEKWKDIKGVEGFYQISNNGRVRSLDRFDGFDVTSISKCCHKKLKTHKGYEWYFFNDFNKDIV